MNKWICTRCLLSVNDRRVPNNCGDVKGQTHEWLDAEEYYYEKKREEEEKLRKIKEEEERKRKKEEEEKWQNFINSSEGQKWQNDFSKIKSTILEKVDSLQKQYNLASEKGNEKFSNVLSEIQKRRDEYNKNVDEYNNNINEYNKGANEHNEKIKETKFLKEKMIPLNKGIWNRLIIGGVGFYFFGIVFEKISLSIIFLIFVIFSPIIFRLIYNISKYKKITSTSKIIASTSKIINSNAANIKLFSNDLHKAREELLQNEYNLIETRKNYLTEIDIFSRIILGVSDKYEGLVFVNRFMKILSFFWLYERLLSVQ